MIYDEADEAIREMNRKNLKAFGRLKLAKWDEISLIREVGTVYDTSAAFAQTRYGEIALTAYIVACYEVGVDHKEATLRAEDAITGDWVLDMLEEADPVTMYAFLPEKERKKQRLIEALAAAHDRNLEIDRALRYWTLQVGQYAINSVDRARLYALRDAGIEKVRWMTADDERVCETCGPRHGRVYGIDEVPPKPHLQCRCWLEAVLD